MGTDTSPPPVADSTFHCDDATGLGPTLIDLLKARHQPPEVLALGEPTHGEPAFSDVRNEVLAALVDQGFRSVVLESDAVAALVVDRYVRGGGQDLDTVLATGFSHRLSEVPANLALVAWLRSHNETRAPEAKVSFHGFDLPLEMTAAPSPRPYLEYLQGYLSRNLPAGSVRHSRRTIDQLLGDDQSWDNPAALMDATRSVGGTPDAALLRVVADDLLTVLHAYAPDLVTRTSLDEWHRADLHARTGLGLLRYHAVAAQPAPPGQRTSQLLGVRDALMAENLMAIRDRERHRGGTLVFASNRHLQRQPSTWRLADMDLRWNSAGSIVATLLGDGYIFLAGSLGASTALALAAPGPNTFEGVLDRATGGRDAVFYGAGLRAVLQDRPEQLHARADTRPEQGYFPLDAATLDQSDGVYHLSRSAEPTPGDTEPLTVQALTARILALPRVTHLVATEEGGAPESNWGNLFFYVEGDELRPFATIVLQDMPGFDEESRLDRPGVFRLNVDLGRQEFEREFGYPPARLGDHRTDIDFTRVDRLTPHPVYGGQGWAAILSPSRVHLDRLDLLLRHAHQKALVRARRHAERRQRDNW